MNGARRKPLAPQGPTTLDPRRPLRLDGHEGAFVVTRGHVDVFARAPQGRRRALFRVEAGEALLGVPGAGGVEVLAVGGADLQPLAVSALESGLADAWGRRLEAVVGASEAPLTAIAAWLETASKTEAARFGDRLARETLRRGGLFAGLARIIAPHREPAPVAGASVDGDPLFAAMGAVARTLGVAPLSRTSTTGPIHEFETLADIARASGLRVRRIILRADWQRQDVGPLVAWRGDSRDPVAVLPTARGYVVFDPRSGVSEVLDRASAQRLAPEAACLYRPLPEGPPSLKGLAGWLASASAADLRRIVLAALGTALIALAPPLLTGVIVDQAIQRSDVGVLAFAALALAAAAVGAAGFLAIQSLAILRLGSKSDAMIQGGLIDRVLRLPAGFFKAYAAGDLADRIFGVETLRNVFSGRAIGGLLAGVFCLFSFLLMATLDPALALVALGLAVVQVTVTVAVTRRQLRHERGYAEVHGRVRALVLQMISGVAKLRVAAGVSRILSLWADRFTEQVERLVAARRTAATLAVFNAAFPVLATLAIFALARPQAGEESGRFLAFFAAFGQAMATLGAFGAALGEFIVAAPALERAWPILAAEPEPRPKGGAAHTLTGAIEVRGVNFAYAAAQRAVLDGLSFNVSPGEFVALVGPSGGGKSTIFRLLLGFERPTAGAVLYDGQPVEALDMVRLRRQIGVVLQDGRLLSGSLYENICGTVILPDEQVWDAVRRAGLEADIANIPMGLHTVITEGSAALSGGQRQRLLIARALVHRPKLLLFDEATSALDNQTQAIVSEALSELSVTRIVIAHRLTTIRDADRILVLDGGRVIQEGDFDTLIRQPGMFADLARRQLT